MQTLAAYNILSAPVSDATSGEYVGMVDVADIMGGVVRGEDTHLCCLIRITSSRVLLTSARRGCILVLEQQQRSCIQAFTRKRLVVLHCAPPPAGVYPELLERGFLEQHKRLSISELQSGARHA